MQNSRLLILFFCLYFIARQLIRFIKHEQSQTVLKTFSIIFIWTGVMSVVLFPHITATLLKFIGMDNLYAFILLAFIVVFLFLFRLLGIIEKIEREITEIVRKEALQGIQNVKRKWKK